MNAVKRIRLTVGRPSLTLLILGVLAVLTMSGGTRVESAPFASSTNAVYCNALSTSFVDPQLAGDAACSDPNPILTATAYPLTVTLTIPASNSVPSEPTYTLLSPDTVIAADASIPNGEKVGGLEVEATVGLLNGPCTTALPVQGVLYDSATTGAPVAPSAEGTSNRFASLVTDANADNIADASSSFVSNNLTIYETLFDPDGTPGVPPVSPITPRARYSGAVKLGGEWQLLSVFVFDPGALAPFNADPTNRPHPLGRVGRTTGDSLIMASVLGDPTAAIVSNSPISDSCAPQSVKAMFLGTTPGAFTRSTTPAVGGTRTIGQYAMGLRDADNDGIENQLDTCPFNTNVGDTDGDGIDDACDPTPAVNTGSGDHDGDGFANRLDNCPLIANGGAGQVESEITTGYSTAASDGGPRTDGIGDACDPNPTTSTTQGSFIHDYNFVPKCIGMGPDADGDGYCSAQDANDSNAAVRGYSLNRGSDQDGTTLTGDNFGANLEHYLGTDPTRGCGFTAGAPSQSETWPADLAESNSVNISDVLALKPHIGQTVPTVSARFDLYPDKFIDLRDVKTVLAVFGSTCPATVPVAPAPVNGNLATLAIDTDITGNDPRLTLGASIQDCVSLPSVGSTVGLDILTPAPGFGAADGFAAWEFNLLFDPAVVRVVGQSVSQLIDQAAGSTDLDFSDVLPDASGDFYSAGMDVATGAPEPAGRDEVGPGVITRITLEAMGTGQSGVVLQNVRLYSSTNGIINVADVLGASIAVGQACIPGSPADVDSDGIDDSIDADPFSSSLEFSDQHGGLVTTGEVISTNGATVKIEDAADSAADESERGVKVIVSGTGGPVTVEFCDGELVELTVPSTTILTCGSTWIVVQSGTARLNMGTYKGRISAVAAAKFSLVVFGEYNIFNHQFSGTTLNIGGLLIPPNTTATNVKDSDGDGWVDQVDFCTSQPTPWRTPAGDDDCDGYSSAAEIALSTDPNVSCGHSPGPPTESDVWPPDLAESGGINISDVLAFKGKFTPTNPFQPRFDLAPDGSINVSDVLRMKEIFGMSC